MSDQSTPPEHQPPPGPPPVPPQVPVGPPPGAPRVEQPTAGWGAVPGALPGDLPAAGTLEDLERRFNLADDPPGAAGQGAASGGAVPGMATPGPSGPLPGMVPPVSAPPGMSPPLPGMAPPVAGSGAVVGPTAVSASGIMPTPPLVVPPPSVRPTELSAPVRPMSLGELFSVAMRSIPAFLAVAVPVAVSVVVINFVVLTLLVSSQTEPAGFEDLNSRFNAIFVVTWLLTLFGFLAGTLVVSHAIAVVAQTVRHGRARISTALLAAVGAWGKYLVVGFAAGVLFWVASLMVGLTVGTGVPILAVLVAVVCYGAVATMALVLTSAITVDLARSA